MHIPNIIFRIAIFLLLVSSLILVISLGGCDNYYKICNENCVMKGPGTGEQQYDLPCSDNVSFMTAHWVDPDLEPQSYIDSFGEINVLPELRDYTNTIAMHSPIYPRVSKLDGMVISDDIKFSLNPVDLIESVVLYIRAQQTDQGELLAETFQLVPINVSDINYNSNPNLKKIEWSLNAGTFKKTLPGSGLSPEFIDYISYTTCFSYPATATPKITFVTYRFEVKYKAGTLPDSENMEITLALQDYHDPNHSLPLPAPVYVQGDMLQLVDILFIPANDNNVTWAATEAFQKEFRASCGQIVENHFFNEPSIRFWRRQFNFWINKDHGTAIDALDLECLDCCHGVPENWDNIPKTIEVKALLHRSLQSDFYDPCTEMFSSEMAPVGDEPFSFVHELGHGAFGLSDEYKDGYNFEAAEHLPNNWESRRRAKKAAVLRHKTEADVRTLR